MPTSVTRGPLSGNNMINGVLWDGWKWNFGGGPQTFSYFLADDGGQGWSPAEATSYTTAINTWASVANLTFTQTGTRSAATFIENISSEAQMSFMAGAGTFGFHYTPQSGGSAFSETIDSTHSASFAAGQVGGFYNRQALSQTAGWTNAQLSSGGFFHRMMIHEIGHGLGLKHPHDAFGGVPTFPGVPNGGNSTLGTNSQNHMFWSVMSYNRNYSFDVNGRIVVQSGNNFTVGGQNVLEYGYMKGPMAYDIAAIQMLYGANTSTGAGASVYDLPDADVEGTGWTCIWDTGGNDVLRYSGTRNAILDLTAATLDGSATGGGVLSYAANIHGGYTIANGVVIENAIGGGGNDTIIGNNGGNSFIGNGGADAMDGKLGLDASSYNVAWGASTITRNLAGSVTINAGSDGIDTLSNMEWAQFTDRKVWVGAQRNDSNNDGRSDILWQNSNGQAAIWQMNGSTLSSAAALVNPGASWRLVGSGDFNADRKADLLWQDSNGQIAEWQMNGTTIAAGLLVTNPTAAWRAVDTGDFNGDSISDIALQNTDGSVAVWNMSNASIVGAAVVSNPGAAWRLYAADDFTGDGTSDLLFQNTNGAVAIWQMNGTSLVAGSVLAINPGAAWHIKGTGDFSNDGRADIVWQHDDGTVAIWAMQDAATLQFGPMTGVVAAPGAVWSVGGVGDYNGDNVADILLQNTATGQGALWAMNGTDLTPTGSFLSVNAGASWHSVV